MASGGIGGSMLIDASWNPQRIVVIAAAVNFMGGHQHGILLFSFDVVVQATFTLWREETSRVLLIYQTLCRPSAISVETRFFLSQTTIV